jgi:hypothetical protein
MAKKKTEGLLIVEVPDLFAGLDLFEEGWQTAIIGAPEIAVAAATVELPELYAAIAEPVPVTHELIEVSLDSIFGEEEVQKGVGLKERGKDGGKAVYWNEIDGEMAEYFETDDASGAFDPKNTFANLYPELCGAARKRIEKQNIPVPCSSSTTTGGRRPSVWPVF